MTSGAPGSDHGEPVGATSPPHVAAPGAPPPPPGHPGQAAPPPPPSPPVPPQPPSARGALGPPGGPPTPGGEGIGPPGLRAFPPAGGPRPPGGGGPPSALERPADEPPRTTAEGGRWLLFAALGFVVGQVLSAVVLEVVAALNGHSSDVSQLAARAVPPGWVVVSGLVGLWIGFAGSTVVVSRTSGTGSLRRDMGLEIRGWDVVVGPVVGLLGQIVVLPLLYLPLEHVVPHLSDRLQQPAKHLTGGFPGGDLAVIAVLTVVVVPVIEELFFRGLVLRALVRLCARAGPALGVALAVVADGIVFGLAHFELLQLLGLSAFGVLLAVMAYRSRRIGPCIFAHATFNLVAVLSVAFPTGVVH